MYELKKIGKVFMSKFVGTGPSSYEKRIYRTAVSQMLRNPTVYVFVAWTGTTMLFRMVSIVGVAGECGMLQTGKQKYSPSN
jgi:hypothetical protein